MAGEVKVMISDFVSAYANPEVPVDDMEEQFEGKLTRIDILNALKEIEKDGVGVLAIGRRGKKTRFLVGAMRVKSTTKPELLEAFKTVIDGMDVNSSMTLEEAEEYFGKNKVQTIDVLKGLQEEGVGRFIIGRRNGKSRFIKGMATNATTSKSKSFVLKSDMDATTSAIPPIQKTNRNATAANQIKYNIVNNILFKSIGVAGGFDTIPDALDSTESVFNDLDTIIEQVANTGFCKLEDFDELDGDEAAD